MSYPQEASYRGSNFKTLQSLWDYCLLYDRRTSPLQELLGISSICIFVCTLENNKYSLKVLDIFFIKDFVLFAHGCVSINHLCPGACRSRKRMWNPWSWSYKHLRAALHSYWGTNSGPCKSRKPRPWSPSHPSGHSCVLNILSDHGVQTADPSGISANGKLAIVQLGSAEVQIGFLNDCILLTGSETFSPCKAVPPCSLNLKFA